MSCLKNGGNIGDILFAMLRSFEADQAVFLSANRKGVDLLNSYALCPDRSYLNQYAEYYWRYDLYVVSESGTKQAFWAMLPPDAAIITSSCF